MSTPFFSHAHQPQAQLDGHELKAKVKELEARWAAAQVCDPRILVRMNGAVGMGAPVVGLGLDFGS